MQIWYFNCLLFQAIPPLRVVFNLEQLKNDFCIIPFIKIGLYKNIFDEFLDIITFFDEKISRDNRR